MGSVEITINRITRVSCIEGLSIVISQAEVVNVFCQPIDVVVGHHRCCKLQELVLEYYDVAVCREDDFSI